MNIPQIIVQSAEHGRWLASFEGSETGYEADTKEMAVGKLVCGGVPAGDRGLFSHMSLISVFINDDAVDSSGAVRLTAEQIGIASPASC